MKRLGQILAGLGVLVLVVVAGPPLTMTRPVTVSATNAAPSFIGVAPAGTNNLLELYQGASRRFAIASNGIPSPFDYGACVSSSDGTVTQAFARTYSAVPRVVSSQVGLDTTVTNVVTVTVSNFVLRVAKADVTNSWIAIGPP
jgi:hypothetical protein